MGEAPSYGLKRGVVVDRQAAAESIAEAMEACGVRGGRGDRRHRRQPHLLLQHGGHPPQPQQGPRRSRTGSSEGLEQEARQLDLHEDEQVIHVVPRGYVLDGSEGVKNPVGLAARKVTMRAHVVSGAVSSIQNLLRAVEDCGVKVSRIVLEPLASAEACLLDADRESGVVLLDIGGGTTDIATFYRGALTHTAVIPIGGESFTSDLAYGLKIPAAPCRGAQASLRYRRSPTPSTPSPPSSSTTATTTPALSARSWSTAPARCSTTCATPWTDHG